MYFSFSVIFKFLAILQVPQCAGCFEKDGKRMLVGRGLGTHSIDIRFNDLPQVLVVRLVPGAFA